MKSMNFGYFVQKASGCVLAWLVIKPVGLPQATGSHGSNRRFQPVRIVAWEKEGGLSGKDYRQ